MTKKTHLGKTIVFLMVFLLLILLISNYFVWKQKYYNRAYPNTTLGTINLSGLNSNEIENIINKKSKEIEKEGLFFVYHDKIINIPSNISSFDSDLSSSILSFNINSTIQNIINKKNQSFVDYLYSKFISHNKKVIVIYNLDEDKLKEILSEKFSELNIPSHNAYFSVDRKNNKKLNINPERIGKEINYKQTFNKLRSNLDVLNNQIISITTETKYPEVKKEELGKLKPQVEKYLTAGDLYLNYQNKSWLVKINKVITWFSVDKKDTSLSLNLDFNKIKEYLEQEVVPEINKEVVRPKFEIKNNKVTNWIIGEEGKKVNIDKTFETIKRTLLSHKTDVKITVDTITNNNYIPDNGFTVKEILGTGYSNFAGSPKNRRHNIKLGADTVHGTIIKPGEEFSLIKTLGEIDKESGYLPELVIKDNKTIPEYGGGLCQIGTTIFRAALAAGLKITERHNHSYRVSYYEPAGTDATIYDPKPDLRFINDTNNYILIQSKINGNILSFDFWGTKDGRTVSTTSPVIYNITKPEEIKIIETTELPVGKKKCTEHSHNGADAYFDYTVTYPPKKPYSQPETKTIRFNSHYIPWQEVCLVGVEATSSPEIKEEQ